MSPRPRRIHIINLLGADVVKSFGDTPMALYGITHYDVPNAFWLELVKITISFVSRIFNFEINRFSFQKSQKYVLKKYKIA